MNKSVFVCIVLLFSLWSTLSLSYIASLALWSKGNKKVGVMGDIHRHGAIDVCHRDLFYPFLEQLAELDRKTRVIIEDVPAESFVSSKPEEDLCLASFSRYAHKYGLKRGNVSFTLGEYMRDIPGLNTFEAMYHILFSALEDKYNSSQFNWLNTNNAYKQTALNSFSTVSDIFLKPLKGDIQTEEGKIFVVGLEKEISNLYAKLDSFFKIYGDEDVTIRVPLTEKVFTYKKGTVAAAFMQALKQGKWQKDVLKDLFYRYVRPVMTLLRDIGFLNDMIINQKFNDNILIYVGGSHAATINNMLLALEYTPLTEPLGSVFESPTSFESRSTKEIEEFFKLFLK